MYNNFDLKTSARMRTAISGLVGERYILGSEPTLVSDWQHFSIYYVCSKELKTVSAFRCIQVSFVRSLHVTIDHVMPREKRCGALDSCFGLVGPHQQSIPQLVHVLRGGFNWPCITKLLGRTSLLRTTR